MAEKQQKKMEGAVEPEVVKDVKNPEDAKTKEDAPTKRVTAFDSWTPKTELGRKVKEGIITDIDEILDSGRKILEPEIVDVLLPNLETDLLLIGQSKGKFGGGARRVFKQTQKKSREGNKPKFATYAVAGNKNGYVGVGYGKAKETVPAREKALRNAKLNIIKIARGCGSWDCGCGTPHSIPFEVHGKCGSSQLTLLSAPRGKGLIVEKECKKILELAGVKDVWSKTKGQTKTKINLINACFEALKRTVSTRVTSTYIEENSVAYGKVQGSATDES